MKFNFLLFIVYILFSSIIFSQEKVKNTQKAKGEDAPQALNDKVEIKNSSGNSILTITDEGNNSSSLLLPAVNSTLTGSKLYNNGGNLYWGDSQLGISGGTGWVKNGSFVNLATPSDFVGIGYTNPTANLQIGSSAEDVAPVIRLSNSGNSHSLSFVGGHSGDAPRISFKNSSALRFTFFDQANTGTRYERMRITSDGKVGIGTENPLSKLSVGGNGNSNASVYGFGQGQGSIAYGGYFEAHGNSDYGVYGYSNGANGKAVGGISGGAEGFAVTGIALDNSGKNYGGYFEAGGRSGIGVKGFASNTGSGAKYGGYFEANGIGSTGVQGTSSSYDGTGGRFVGGYYGVFAQANSELVAENYGGYFEALGGQGVGIRGRGNAFGGRFTANNADAYGVYGYASNLGGTNYGGYFQSAGITGIGVKGTATGTGNGNEPSIGVFGEATGQYGNGMVGQADYSGEGTTYGGKFISKSSTGIGVEGRADNNGDYINYGGYFEAGGRSGIGVKGFASNTGSGAKYGGYFEANGIGSTGVLGKGDNFDFYADGPGVNYGEPSSRRWKNNIKEIESPLEKLDKIRGVYFDWDEEHGGEHDVGMIAEEVGEVLPEIVVYEENGIDAEGMDYGKLTPLLVEVAKAQQKRIEELESKINKLMGIIALNIN